MVNLLHCFNCILIYNYVISAKQINTMMMMMIMIMDRR